MKKRTRFRSSVTSKAFVESKSPRLLHGTAAHSWQAEVQCSLTEITDIDERYNTCNFHCSTALPT